MMKGTKRIAAAGLSVLFLCGAAVPASAKGTASEKEEIVYIKTDPSGGIQSVNVVNRFSGGGKITDYGDYSAVKMLTSTDPIAQNGDQITFTTDADQIYYQGTLEGKEIPWKIGITYYLDGKKVTPARLAGKSGALKIRFSVQENPRCDGTYFDDYALQASFTLDTDRCREITAGGATVANVGSDKQLTYTILPGKGLTTTIEADVTDFEMDAVQINGIKLNLNVEIDEDELMEKVEELMDATAKLNDGARELDTGAGDLESGSGTLKDGISTLNSGISELDQGIAALQTGTAAMEKGLSQLNAKSGTLTEGSAQVREALETIQSSLDQVSVGTDQLEQLTAASGAVKQGIGDLYDGITALQSNLGYAQYKGIMAQNGLDIDALKEGNQQAISNLSETIAGLQATLDQIRDIPGYEEQAADLEAQIQQLQTIATLLQGDNVAIGGIERYLDSLSGAAAELQAGAAELKTQYEQFDSAIAQLTGTLSEMVVKLSALSDGIDQLVTQYAVLDDGIGQYTDGVAELVVGYRQLVGGVSDLAAGSKQLVNGSEEACSGVAELYDGVVTLCDGTAELADGTEELHDETSDMDTQVQDEIDALMESIQGDETETVSFVSRKNTSVDAVQFVIKTAAIEKEEEAEPEAQEEEPLSVWQKLLNLFSRS